MSSRSKNSFSPISLTLASSSASTLQWAKAVETWTKVTCGTRNSALVYPVSSETHINDACLLHDSASSSNLPVPSTWQDQEEATGALNLRKGPELKRIWEKVCMVLK